ncbi:MAG: porin family protein [Pseudomonadota bacterium]
MKKTAFTAILASLALAPVAVADSELYVNGGVSVFDTDEATINALNMRGGLNFNEIMGAEFEAAFGLGAEDLDSPEGAQIEVENQFSGFFVGRYPVLSRVDVLGRVGYTTGELQVSNSGVSTDAEIDGFAFGIGGEFMFTDSFGLRGDYTRIEADDDQFDGGINVIAIVGVFKFGELR